MCWKFHLTLLFPSPISLSSSLPSVASDCLQPPLILLSSHPLHRSPPSPPGLLPFSFVWGRRSEGEWARQEEEQGERYQGTAGDGPIGMWIPDIVRINVGDFGAESLKLFAPLDQLNWDQKRVLIICFQLSLSSLPIPCLKQRSRCMWSTQWAPLMSQICIPLAPLYKISTLNNLAPAEGCWNIRLLCTSVHITDAFFGWNFSPRSLLSGELSRIYKTLLGTFMEGII